MAQQRMQNELSAVMNGGDLDPQRAGLYQRAGLLDQNQDASGASRYAVNSRGVGILDRDDQDKIAADPSQYTLTDDAAAQMAQRRPQALARIGRQTWQQQQSAILTQFPQVGVPGSPAYATFAQAYRSAGSDPRRALQVARAVL